MTGNVSQQISNVRSLKSRKNSLLTSPPMCRMKLIAAVLFMTLNLVYSIRSPSEFHCGSGEEDRQLAFEYINDSCPHNIMQANNCCEKHDECYTKQLGQEHCDHVFCECLDVNVAEGAINGSCKSVSEWYCFTVSLFGHTAYELSAPNDTVVHNKTEDKEVSVPHHCGFDRSLPIAFYDAISSHCPQYGDSFHSCCIRHNKCVLDETGSEECHADFCDCVEASVHEQGRPSCAFATQGFCRNSFSERTIFGSRATYHFWSSTVHQYGFSLAEIVVLALVFVMCIIGVSMALYCALGRLQKTLTKVSELEFMSPIYSHLRDADGSV
uniref:Vitellogenin receptor n=1 Tax=Steinernema glaseri TaxID=37863 RepID=A0A1I7ZJB6_9BILA